ncbi:MAG TPA: hypothetical protein VMR51_00065 [Patescibacteria group bacterium]|nr:hypothetical protein [Patescibacteria group bacterium]
MALTLAICIICFSWPASAAIGLPNRSIQLDNPLPSANGVNYVLSFDLPSNYNLGSITIQFCQNSPLEAAICQAPAGFDASSVQLNAQSGETGFTINPNTNTNQIVIGRTPAMTTATNLSYSFGNITNPSATGQFFAKIFLYSSSDGTGIDDYFGGIALDTNSAVGINTTVPPYLLFCAAATIAGYDCSTADNYYLDFGNFGTGKTSATTSEMVVSENAAFGFNIQMFGNTMTSGNNIINPIATQGPALTGTSQFGLNLRVNNLLNIGNDPVGIGNAVVDNDYNTPNQFKFNSGDTLVAGVGPIAYQKFTPTYIVNINSNAAPGVYSTTITYICLANF